MTRHPWSLAWALLLLLAGPAHAQIAGTVREAESGLPIAGAAVSVTDLRRSALTDTSGRYVLDGIPAGPHQLNVRMIGHLAHGLHVLVPHEGGLQLNVALQDAPLPLHPFQVHAPPLLRGLEREQPAGFPDRGSSIAALQNHPLLSEPDVFQGLEGGDVEMHPESPDGVHLLGGASDQTGFRLDGIPVFSPYHASGITSAWNPDALSRLDLVSSTHAPDPVHALSGTIDGATLRPRERSAAEGSISTSQMRITVDGPLGAGGAGYVLSTRSGFAGLITRKHEPSHLKGEVGDWLAKLQAPVFGGEAQVLGYGNSNEITATAVAESATVAVLPRNDFEWHGDSMGAAWKRDFESGSLRFLTWSAAADEAARWSRISAPVDLAATRRDLGFRLAAERRSERASMNADLMVERSQTSYRIDSDSLAGPRWLLEAQSPVVTATVGRKQRIGARVELDLGASVAAAAGDLFAAPRGQLRWSPTDHVTLSGGYSRTHQFAQSLRNQESIVGHVFPVDAYVGSGAPGIPVAASHLGVLAADVHPRPGMHAGLQAYARSSTGLLLVAPRDGEPFSTGGFTIGSEESWGATVEAAMSSARVGLLASYGFQHARLSYGDSSYVPEYAIAHSIQGGVIVFPTASTSARLGVSAGIGRRTTIVPGAIEWESCNLTNRGCEFAGTPDYGSERLGAILLPPYCRLDFGLRQQWRLPVAGREAAISFFGAISNVLGRTNLMTYARDPRTGRLMGIELRPSSPLVAGLDWRF